MSIIVDFPDLLVIAQVLDLNRVRCALAAIPALSSLNDLSVKKLVPLFERKSFSAAVKISGNALHVIMKVWRILST